MTKGNSLGGLPNSVLPKPTKPTSTKDVVVTINDKPTHKLSANRSAIACCIVTTVLVGVGVSIATWYAVTEI